jgi:hypothetical protein
MIPSAPKTWTLNPGSVRAYGLQCRHPTIAATKPLRRRNPSLVLISALPRSSAHTAISRLLPCNIGHIVTIKPLQACRERTARSEVLRHSGCIATGTALENNGEFIAMIKALEGSRCITAITVLKANNEDIAATVQA